jgi:hypothetical protein
MPVKLVSMEPILPVSKENLCLLKYLIKFKIFKEMIKSVSDEMNFHKKEV